MTVPVSSKILLYSCLTPPTKPKVSTCNVTMKKNTETRSNGSEKQRNEKKKTEDKQELRAETESLNGKAQTFGERKRACFKDGGESLGEAEASEREENGASKR